MKQKDKKANIKKYYVFIAYNVKENRYILFVCYDKTNEIYSITR
jgi:hypothetical protein